MEIEAIITAALAVELRLSSYVPWIPVLELQKVYNWLSLAPAAAYHMRHTFSIKNV